MVLKSFYNANIIKDKNVKYPFFFKAKFTRKKYNWEENALPFSDYSFLFIFGNKIKMYTSFSKLVT